jgi:hypothetical protein
LYIIVASPGSASILLAFFYFLKTSVSLSRLFSILAKRRICTVFVRTSPLDSTPPKPPRSVDSNRLTENLNCLESTLMKKPGGGAWLTQEYDEGLLSRMRFLHPEWFCGTTIGSERSFRLSDQGAFFASRQSPASLRCRERLSPATTPPGLPLPPVTIHQSLFTSHGPFDPFDKAPCLV